MTTTSLHTAFERLTSLFRTSLREVATAHKLKLVQLETLVYLSMANRYSDTPVAVAEYFQITKGTVSQTIKVLEERDLINKIADRKDGRILHCRLTPRAKKIVKEANPAPLFRVLDESLQSESAALLRRILHTLQFENDMKTFGQCRTCRLFQPEGKKGHCGLTQESLSIVDSSKLCREHRFADGLA